MLWFRLVLYLKVQSKLIQVTRNDEIVINKMTAFNPQFKFSKQNDFLECLCGFNCDVFQCFGEILEIFLKV